MSNDQESKREILSQIEETYVLVFAPHFFLSFTYVISVWSVIISFDNNDDSIVWSLAISCHSTKFLGVFRSYNMYA